MFTLTDAMEDVTDEPPMSLVPVATVVFGMIGWIMVIIVVIVVVIAGVWYWRHQKAKKYHLRYV